MKKRPCLFPKCITTLNSYNKDRFCSLHQRIIAQNELLYIGKTESVKIKVKLRKGFYIQDPRKPHQINPLTVFALTKLKGLPIDLPDETI